MQQQSNLAIMPVEDLIALIEGLLEKYFNDGKVPYNSLTGDPKKVYSRKEVADILNRSENTVTKYIKQRKLVASNLNGVYYISESALFKFINQPKNAKN